MIDEILLHFKLANGARALIVIAGLISTVFLLGKIGKEGWFFLAGTVILAISGGITTYLNSVQPSSALNEASILQTGMFYYRVGLLIQILFFAMGISYKSQLVEKIKAELEIELLKQKFESEINKQKAIESTRSAIASDLHDDIGATLSSINIYSKLVHDKIYQQSGQPEPLITRISDASQEIMNNMSDVIWAIKPENDAADQFTLRIKNMMHELFSARNIMYGMDAEWGPVQRLNMNANRSLMLIIKEALNNISKYSEASEVNVKIRADDNQLHLTINDNGQGFNNNGTGNGNGLKNMKFRTENLRGTFNIFSHPGEGTQITAVFDIDKIIY
jgi:signal transduction histidine kinase